MKLKKLIFMTGFVSTATISILTYDKCKYADNVYSHKTEENHDANIIAHRGFSSLEVENSSQAVEKGFDLNCTDGVEIDVRLSEDENVVLSHNPFVFGLGEIKDKSLDDLKKRKYSSCSTTKLSCIKELLIGKDGKIIYDRYNSLKSKEETITTLDEVVDDNDYNKILLVDLKFNDENDNVLYSKVDEVFKDYAGNLEIIIQGNDYDKLLEMKKQYPDYNYQLIISKKKQLKYLDSDFNMFCIKKDLITKDLVENLLSQNKTINIWTVNTYNDFKELSDELGDLMKDVYIITDYPDEMCYLYNKSKKKLILK